MQLNEKKIIYAMSLSNPSRWNQYDERGNIWYIISIFFLHNIEIGDEVT